MIIWMLISLDVLSLQTNKLDIAFGTEKGLSSFLFNFSLLITLIFSTECTIGVVEGDLKWSAMELGS